MKTLKTWVAAATMLAFAGTAQAALINQGNGTVKDTNTNLIWLQDWDVNGLTNWSTQKAWAEGLDFAGSTDWELPEISEYGVLFAAYGNLTLEPQFSNVRSGHYWSGTEFPGGNGVWYFFPDSGSQDGANARNRFFAVAVRPGDVTASVPEPQTLALALLALGATVVARRRRPA